jgi:3-keto-disaccharide hydrolase
MRFLSTLLLLAVLSAAPVAAHDLSNGKNLDGWTVVTDPDKDASATWSVRDGVIACAGKPRGYLRTNESYENYRLRLQWRWPEKPGNSGVFVHGSTADKVWPHCYEAQLAAGNAGEIRANGGAKFHEESKPEDKSMPKLGDSSERTAGEWNDYEIVARGGEVVLSVNGVRQNALTSAALRSGWIALQSEGAPIEFRAISIEPLPAEGTGRPTAVPPATTMERPDGPKKKAPTP